MTDFDKREKAHENKFANDKEREFKLNARRNKLMAQWIAEYSGKSAEETQAYIVHLIQFGSEVSGDEALVKKIAKDLGEAGKQVDENEIYAQLERYKAIASEQIS